MSIRSLVYDSLLGSAAIHNLFGSVDAAQDGIYPVAPDTPEQNKWLILAWESATPPLGRDSRARVRELRVWAYDKCGALDWIDSALSVAAESIQSLEGVKDDESAILGVMVADSSGDLYDDVYGARTRNVTIRIGIRD
jgi:hypothetical protein